MNQIEIYQTKDDQTQVEVRFNGGTVWLTQKQISAVFGTEIPAVNKHIKNIIKEKELRPEATVSKMEIVQMEGERQVTREVEVYNLDAVIAVGYRVNSIKATHFRIWATNTLREFIVKGFVLNDQMLKNMDWETRF